MMDILKQITIGDVLTVVVLLAMVPVAKYLAEG